MEGENLILSSSDDSDPPSNGRRYEMYWPTLISPLVRTICYILTVVLLLLLYLHRINQAKEASVRNFQIEVV